MTPIENRIVRALLRGENASDYIGHKGALLNLKKAGYISFVLDEQGNIVLGTITITPLGKKVVSH